MNRAALILAAHGSSSDGSAAAPVLRHAETLRSSGRYAEVACVFLAQTPALEDLPAMVDAPRLTIVPVLTSEGYYARLIAERAAAVVDRPFNVTRPIGVLPAFADLASAQGVRALAAAGRSPVDTHLLLVGHGTRRDPRASGAATRRAAGRIRSARSFADVSVAFIDQDPPIAEALPAGGSVVVVPFLIANGPHARIDVRDAVGSGERIVFADAAGEHEGCAAIIDAIATRQPEACTT